MQRSKFVRRSQTLGLLAACCAAFGCQAEPGAAGAEPDAASVGGAGSDPSHANRDPGPPGFCERPADDLVRDAFCVASPARVRSLQELRDSLGIVLPTEYNS